MRPEVPPPVLDGDRLLAYAIVDETVNHTGSSTLYVDGKQIGAVPCLAVVQQETGGVLLLFCDEQWNSVGVVECSSLAEAQSRAGSEYRGLSPKWVNANVTEQEAAQYLEEQSNSQRCSFCGKPPVAVQQLFAAPAARICDECVRDFFGALETPPDPRS
jgi:ClpX C4-type zinc finger